MPIKLQTMNVFRAQVVNRAVVLNLLRYQSGHSRASVARSTGLSTTAAANIINELVDEGIVIETDERQDTVRGRKGKVISLNPGYAYAIGMEVTDRELRAIAADFTENPVHSVSRSLAGLGAREVIDEMEAAIADLISLTGRGNLYGARIALPGIVDLQEGVSITFPGVSGWKPAPVGRILSERLGIPVSLDIRLVTGTTAELRFGVGKEFPDFVYFNSAPETGFGIGIVANGRVVLGQEGLGGQFGHIYVDPRERQCFCGRRGCLVTVASPHAITKEISAAIQSGVETAVSGTAQLTFRDVVQAARLGDSLCYNALERAGEFLGVGLSHVLNLLSPDAVVLSGLLTEAWDIVVDAMKRTARRHTISAIFDRVKIVRTALDETAAARGAVARLLDGFFAVDPTLIREF